jgi:hypothetical protein
MQVRTLRVRIRLKLKLKLGLELEWGRDARGLAPSCWRWVALG